MAANRMLALWVAGLLCALFVGDLSGQVCLNRCRNMTWVYLLPDGEPCNRYVPSQCQLPERQVGVRFQGSYSWETHECSPQTDTTDWALVHRCLTACEPGFGPFEIEGKPITGGGVELETVEGLTRYLCGEIPPGSM